MDRNVWQLYCAVLESGSVTETAERFYLSQPAVSMQLRKLERSLGAQLLYRSGRQMRPTEAGLAVYNHAKERIKAESELVAVVSELRDGTAGQVSIGATHMVGSYYLPPRLSEFARVRPDADVSVQIVPKERLWTSVLAGDLDFAMTTSEGMPAGLVRQEFHQEHFVVVCSPGHPLAHLEVVSLTDLRHYPLVALSRDTGVNQIIEARLCGPDPLHRPRVAMHLGHAEAIKRVVATGLGYGVLFTCAVESELQLGLLNDITPVDMDVSYQPFALVYRAKKHFSPLQRQLLTFLVNTSRT